MTPIRSVPWLVLIAFVLAVTVAYSVMYGHSATAPANGLTVEQLEAALPAAEGFGTRRTEGPTYRERLLGNGSPDVLGAYIDHAAAEVHVFAYAGGPPDDEESAAWRAEVDRIVARLGEEHPGVGEWTHDDFTANSFRWVVLGGCGLGTGVLLLVTVRLLRSRSQAA